MDEENTVIDPVSQANDNDRALRQKKLDDLIGQTGLKAN